MTVSPERRPGNVGRGLVTTTLDTVRPEPVRYLVPDLIPLGKLVMFAGKGGVGKTEITLDLTAAVTTGRPAFGLSYPSTDPANVLLISCEDDPADTIVPRLLACGADHSRVKFVKGTDGGTDKAGNHLTGAFTLANFRELEETLEDNPTIRLGVIDPAGAYIGRTRVDDHKDSELRSLLGPLAEVAARRSVTIILVKHLSKSASASAIDRVSGSVGYVNACRAVFLVTPDPTEPGRTLFLPGKGNHLRPGTRGRVFRLSPLSSADRERVSAYCGHLRPADRDELLGQLFRPTWDGAAEIDADAAFSETPRPRRADACAEWLVRFLGPFAWPEAEVRAAAQKEGFTQDNLKEAKTKLRREKRPLATKPKDKGGPCWSWIGDDRPAERPHTNHTPHSPESPETSGPDPDCPHTPDTREIPPDGKTGECGESGGKGSLGQESGVWGDSGAPGDGSPGPDQRCVLSLGSVFGAGAPDLLSAEPGDLDDRYAFEERAAILEFSEGLSREEAERRAREEMTRVGVAGEGGAA